MPAVQLLISASPIGSTGIVHGHVLLGMLIVEVNPLIQGILIETYNHGTVVESFGAHKAV